MGMVKSEYNDYKTRMEDFEVGLEWMTKYGVKTFRDHTGELVEVRCSRMTNFFDNEFEVYEHLSAETV